MKNLLLALLAPGPAHGYDLKRAYDALVASVWPPENIGQVYTTLSRLERDGLVAKTHVEQDDRPDKKVVELTELGRKELEAWLREPSEPPPVKSDMVLRLLAARLTGIVEPAELIAAQRERLLRALRELDEFARGLEAGGDDGPVPHLLTEGSALHVDAELRWLERCEERLVREARRGGRRRG